MSSGKPSAKNVPEEEILRVLRANPGKWHTWVRVNGTMPSLVDSSDVLAAFPSKVLLAKLSSMIKKGVIEGCACGCRGDFHVDGRVA